MSKESKFGSRFLQASFVKMLRTNDAFDMLFKALSEKDIDSLIEQNVFFARCYSPSSIVELSNVPSSDIIYLITFESNYLSKFPADEIVAILLHEIGHSKNPAIKFLEGEYLADAFVKERGYSHTLIRGLQRGLQSQLIGFDAQDCQNRILKLK
jgi:hypothetical protein